MFAQLVSNCGHLAVVSILTPSHKKEKNFTQYVLDAAYLESPVSSTAKQILEGGTQNVIIYRYMTTLTDLQVIGELGWTVKAISDQTGNVPAFW